MKARPILFSGPMVRALLAGEKTQTRRRMKLQPDDDAVITIGEIGTSQGVAYIGNRQSGGIRTRLPCPYGRPGDLLWVRETWQQPALCPPQYRATATERIGHWDPKVGPWRPSIHMPRWASRLTLRITEVRVQRLHNLTADDAEAEGWPHRATGGVGVPLRDAYPIGWYANLWNDINGTGSWAENPWVWALTFEVERRSAVDVPKAVVK